MALITIQEVQRRAQVRGIDLDSYGDEELESMIDDAQGFIETETGRTFGETSFEQENFDQDNSFIVLDNYPIKSIDKIEINDVNYSLQNIRVDKKAGIIFLDAPGSWGVFPFVTGELYDYKVNYTGGHVGDKFFKSARKICMDIVIATLKSEDGTPSEANVTSIREGDLQINYDTNKDDPLNYMSRLKKLKRPRMVMI